MRRVHCQSCQTIRASGRIPWGTDLGKSKVENFGVATLCHKDVGGLYVPMNDSLGVGGIEAVRHIDRKSQKCLEFQGPARDAVL
jgi:hypothetical protein